MEKRNEKKKKKKRKRSVMKTHSPNHPLLLSRVLEQIKSKPCPCPKMT
jgi:hypothetical protein